MFLSVVVPCFNEEEGLREFYARMRRSIDSSSIHSYEMVFVDDGSRDATWDVILELKKIDNNVRGIRLSRNFGHQSALAAGLHGAKGQYIFIIDSDLQDPPELLPSFVAKANSGFDVVYGQRNIRHGETYFKKMSALLFYRVLSSMADIDIPKDTGDFRLINKKVLDAYNRLSESHRFTRGLIAWLGFKQTALVYDRHPRFAGVTKYPLKKMISFSFDAVTGFSLKPLRLIILLGVISSFISAIIFLYTIWGWLFLRTTPGWASIMTVVLFLSSVQLICIGVIGEYVGRTLTEAKRRPLFLIDETV